MPNLKALRAGSICRDPATLASIVRGTPAWRPIAVQYVGTNPPWEMKNMSPEQRQGWRGTRLMNKTPQVYLDARTMSLTTRGRRRVSTPPSAMLAIPVSVTARRPGIWRRRRRCSLI
jgi:hypothetical protein